MTFPLADALCWLLAARQQVLDVMELEQKGPENPVVAEGLAGTLQFFSDLCHVQVARAAGEAGRICAELVNGYNRHPAWDDAGYKGCFRADELDGAGESDSRHRRCARPMWSALTARIRRRRARASAARA